MVQTAKIFNTDRGQVVKLPEAFRFEGKEVFIRKDGGCVILSDKPVSWDDFFNSSKYVSADFMEERIELPPQERKLFE